MAVLSGFDEGTDLVLYYKHLMVLNGDEEYRLHFNESDALSPSQKAFAETQYALFRLAAPALPPAFPSGRRRAVEAQRRFRARIDHRLAVKGRVDSATSVGDRQAVIPSIAGWARMTGLNTIFIDDREPFAKRFQVL